MTLRFLTRLRCDGGWSDMVYAVFSEGPELCEVWRTGRNPWSEVYGAITLTQRKELEAEAMDAMREAAEAGRYSLEDNMPAAFHDACEFEEKRDANRAAHLAYDGVRARLAAEAKR